MKNFLRVFLAIFCYGFLSSNLVFAATPTQLFQINTIGTTDYPESIVFNSALYFSNGELVKSNGTNTFVIKDIYSGSNKSYPQKFTIFNNRLFFVANDGYKGREIWSTDGALDTVILKDINATGSSSSDPDKFMVWNNMLYFIANDGVHGKELWRTDGTSAGTTIVKDIYTGSMNGVADVFAYGDSLYLSATDTWDNYELWKSDGSDAGTVKVAEINDSSSSYPGGFIALGETLLFSALDSVHGYELWKTDGTPEGTLLIKDINPNGDSLPSLYDPKGKIVYHNNVYFTADDGVHGRSLWRTNGTNEGTILFKELSDVSDFVVFNDYLFFWGYHPQFGKEIWVSDGTILGTKVLADINPGTAYSYYSYNKYQILNGRLYFFAYSALSGSEIWSTNGTGGGTQLTVDLSTGAGSLSYSYPMFMTTLDDTNLLFRATSNINGQYLWKVGLPDQAAPGTPTNLYANPIGDIYTKLLWQDGVDNFSTILDHVIEYKVSGDLNWTSINTNSGDPSFLLTGLTLGETYTYRVKSINGIGESSFSEEYEFTTAIPGVLESPSNLLVQASGLDSLGITITWDAPEFTGGYPILYYVVEYKLSGESWDNPENTLYTEGPVTTLNDISLYEYESTYDFRVAAVVDNDFEKSPYSQTYQYTTPPISVPEAPILFLEGVGLSWINVGWATPITYGSPINNFVLAYRPTGGDWIEITIPYDPDDPEVYYNTIQDLASEVTYEIKIKAVSEIGDSLYSDIITATTHGMSEPRNLSVSAAVGDGKSINLTWVEPLYDGSGEGVSVYIVEYKRQQDSWEDLLNRIYLYSDEGFSYGEANEILANGVASLPYFSTTYDIRVFAAIPPQTESGDYILGPASATVQYTTPEAVVHYIKDCSDNTNNDNLGLLGIYNWGSSDTYYLANDIDCTGVETYPIVMDEEDFSGVLDGQDHSIINFTYSGADYSSVGLFASLWDGAIIRNLEISNVDDATLSGGEWSNIGTIAGTAGGNIILENLSVNNTLISYEGYSIGGLIGSYYDNYGKIIIKNSTFNGSIEESVDTNSGIGGLIGSAGCDGAFLKCVSISNVDVNADLSQSDNVGGLIGNISGNSPAITIENSTYIGNLNGFAYMGGLLGNIQSRYATISIHNSSSAGTMTGSVLVGGLIGNVETKNIDISESNSIMNISGVGSVGGLLGQISVENQSNISKSYFSGEIDNTLYDSYAVSGQVGGVVGLCSSGILSIDNSSSNGLVTSNYNNIGGLVGRTDCWSTNIENSYAQISIEGDGINNIGGLIGGSNIYEDQGSLVFINNAYASVNMENLSGSLVGGLIGSINGLYSIEPSSLISPNPLTPFSYIISNSFSSANVPFPESFSNYGGIIGKLDSGNLNLDLKLINTYYDQSSAGTDACVGLNTADKEFSCNKVNVDGNDNAYFLGNSSNAPLNKWQFGNVWGVVIDDFPELMQNASDDSVKPEITILGENPVTIIRGNEYIDAGATAIDNIDGNVTSEIIATNNVDISTLGNYYVIYNVCDSSGNCSTAIRSVTVTIPPPLTLTATQHSYINVPRTFTAVLSEEAAAVYDQCEWMEMGSPKLTFSAPNELTTTVTSDTVGDYAFSIVCWDEDYEVEENLIAETTLSVNIHADIDDDLIVGVNDYTLLLFNWGNNPMNIMADLTNDGIVNNDDYTILLFWWGNYIPV